MAKEKIINEKSLEFLERYLNNASPTGYELAGQKNLDGLCEALCG